MNSFCRDALQVHPREGSVSIEKFRIVDVGTEDELSRGCDNRCAIRYAMQLQLTVVRHQTERSDLPIPVIRKFGNTTTATPTCFAAAFGVGTRDETYAMEATTQKLTA